MATTKGFYINFHGDHTVGINDAEWTLTGYFDFENELDLNEFKEKLTETFEYVSDTPISVETFEEREREIEEERRALDHLS